jgi:hypothetical protein
MAGIEVLIEILIKYTLMLIVISVFLLICLLVLLYARNYVMKALGIRPLRSLFEQICEISDRLDEPYMSKNPYGNAMWLPPVILKGFLAIATLMFLWIMITAIR